MLVASFVATFCCHSLWGFEAKNLLFWSYCDDDSGQDNEMDWTNQSGEAYWDIGIDGMSESVRMEKMDQKCEQTSTFG